VPPVVHVIPKDQSAVRGVTTLGGELFVVRNKSSTIVVYNALDYVESSRITIPAVTSPQCIVSCPHYNCLYVSDARGNNIYRVQLSDSSVTDWCVYYATSGLSVTSSHHLLVSQYSSNSLFEYATDGDCL